ncbi:MAG: Trm112 family protein [Candidatus Acidiferrales bacterium]
MAVPQDLLDILVCPVCKTPVKVTGNQQGLKCSTCRRVYPIRDDIPVMLVDEARVDPS